MSFLRISLVAGAGTVALVALAVGQPRPAAAASFAHSLAAQKYFGCPVGYTFQVSGSNARCYVAGTTSTANIVCGFGYVKAIDQFANNRDACQHQMTNVVGNYTCPSGFSSKAQPGPDICTKTGAASIIAPTIEKSL